MDPEERGAKFLLGLLLLLALLAFVVVRPFLNAVVLAFVTAYLLRRPSAWLARRTRRPRLAALLFVIGTLALLVAPVVVVAVLLADDALDLAESILDRGIENEIARVLGIAGVTGPEAAELTAAALASLQALALRLARELPPGVFFFFIGLFVYLFVLYFGLLEGDRALAFVRRAIPLKPRRMDLLVAETGRTLDAVFRGEILIALLQGTIAGLGWWLFGYPNPVFWGFVMTLLSIIPWTGAPLVIVPVGLYTALATGDLARGFGFVAFGVLLVGTIDNLVRPFVIGKRGKLHPAIVLVGIVGGLDAFGVMGLFLGPLLLSLLVAVVRVWSDEAHNRHPEGA